MEPIRLPTKIELIPGKEEHQATLVVEPCFQGYGTTLGNALRRVMLSSLPGAAVTAVKISGAQHEFSTLPNVKEDVLEIILNLKQLRLRVHSEEPVRLNLKKTGEGKVKAKDIEANADVEIVNPDLHIATITDGAGELEMEIIASRGRGFITTEDRGKEKEIGVIAIDSIFTPIKSVGYQVVDTRVGQITNFDKLMLTVETDGTIDAKDAIEQAAKLLLEHFELFRDLSGKEGEVGVLEKTDDAAEETAVEETDEAEAPKKSKKKKAE
jgi:DNA-directed RNA polymerase subunit alpha